MWVKVLLLSFSIILIAVSFPRSIASWLETAYRWQPKPSSQERVKQLESINAWGIDTKRAFELGKHHLDQALKLEDADAKKQAYEQAVASFEKLLDYNPHHQVSLHNMAVICMNQREYAQSQAYFTELFDIVTKRDFGAQVRLSYYKMCFYWSFVFQINKQTAQEKFLLQKAQEVFASTKPFVYWRWNQINKDNKLNLDYIDFRLMLLKSIEAEAPDKFIEVSF